MRTIFTTEGVKMCVSVIPANWRLAFKRLKVFPRLSGIVSGPLSYR